MRTENPIAIVAKIGSSAISRMAAAGWIIATQDDPNLLAGVKSPEEKKNPAERIVEGMKGGVIQGAKKDPKDPGIGKSAAKKDLPGKKDPKDLPGMKADPEGKNPGMKAEGKEGLPMIAPRIPAGAPGAETRGKVRIAAEGKGDNF
jgi:hypothetical protein